MVMPLGGGGAPGGNPFGGPPVGPTGAPGMPGMSKPMPPPMLAPKKMKLPGLPKTGGAKKAPAVKAKGRPRGGKGGGPKGRMG